MPNVYIVHVLYVTVCFVEVVSDYNVPVYSIASCNCQNILMQTCTHNVTLPAEACRLVRDWNISEIHHADIIDHQSKA